MGISARDPDYCWEVFSRATQALGSGKGEVKERLVEAAREISGLDSQQLPEQLQMEYERLWAMLNSKGSFRETIATMRKDKASQLAAGIMDMERELRNHCR